MSNQKELITIPNSSYPIRMSVDDKMLEFRFTIGFWQPKFFDKSLMFTKNPSFLVTPTNIHPNIVDASTAVTMNAGNIITSEVTPEIIQTDDSLRRISPTERECYFDGER